MDDLIKATRDLVVRKDWGKMPIEARFTDLAEEVGELANAILVTEGHKNKKRQRADLADSLADILWDLIIIADYYKIDLKKEYLEMVERLKKRIKDRNFSDD